MEAIGLRHGISRTVDGGVGLFGLDERGSERGADDGDRDGTRWHSPAT